MATYTAPPELSDDMRAKAQLYKKLSEVMAAVGKLPKDGQNSHFGYKFATDQTVYTAVRQLLAERSIILISEMADCQMVESAWVVAFNFTFCDGDTGATITSRWYGEAVAITSKGTRDDKGLNKTATAALKYFLLKTFIIATGDDPDADGEGATGRKRQHAAPALPPAHRLGAGDNRRIPPPQSTAPATQPPPQTDPVAAAAEQFDAISSAAVAPKPQDTAYEGITFDKVNLQPKTGNTGFRYILLDSRNPRNVNPVLYDGDKMRKAGIDVDGLKAQGRGMHMLLAKYVAKAKWDTARALWEVEEIVEVAS
jgi:ERF superfamily